MRRIWLRPLWMLLALILLIEAWLWDRLVPVMRRVVDALPWQALKELLAQWLARLSPYPTLLALGGALLAACGSDGGSSSTTATAAAPATTTASTAPAVTAAAETGASTDSASNAIFISKSRR